MSKTKISASQKLQRAAYEAQGRAAKNRAKRLKRHLKNHPNDVQTINVLNKTKPHRQKPKIRGNYPPAKFNLRDAAGHKLELSES